MGIKDLSDSDLEVLVGLQCRLSPENLCGDGELPQRVWRANERRLRAELKSARERLGLTVDEVDECAVLMEDERRRKLRKASSSAAG